MHFTKMHGAGNDFIIINNMIERLPACLFPHIAAALCERRFSIGADGLMIISPPRNGGDFYMHFYNADGSEGEMCGNGARCICRYAIEHNLSTNTIHIETKAGPVTGYRQSSSIYTVSLNTPTTLIPELPLTLNHEIIDCSYLELGNPGLPHAVIPMPELSLIPTDKLYHLARQIRFHPAFPKGTNVNFYDILPNGIIRELTYERGVEDFTYACGTGTGCVASILVFKRLISPQKIQFQVRGGLLEVSITPATSACSALTDSIREILLSGPAVTVASGTIWQPDVIPESLPALADSICSELQGNG